ncbi:hypothetical protein V5O48_015588, partial [Marasmius crinis-equi]
MSGVYSIPNIVAQHAQSSGMLRGAGPSETFAYHLNLTAGFERQNTPDFKFPSGAIALCAAAYQRALEIFEPGYNKIDAKRKVEKAKALAEGKKPPKVNDDSFVEAKWDKRIKQLVEVTAD